MQRNIKNYFKRNTNEDFESSSDEDCNVPFLVSGDVNYFNKLLKQKKDLKEVSKVICEGGLSECWNFFGSLIIKDKKVLEKYKFCRLCFETEEVILKPLRSDQLVYIGLRDIDPYEAFILNKLGIRAYAMDSVDKYGIAKIMEMTLDALDVNNKIHVSFDVDALDVKVAPSTGTAVSGGLSLREGLFVVESLSETKRVQGVDLVELNPYLGTAKDVETTVSAAIELLKIICGGYRRRGNFENIDETLVNMKLK